MAQAPIPVAPIAIRSSEKRPSDMADTQDPKRQRMDPDPAEEPSPASPAVYPRLPLLVRQMVLRVEKRMIDEEVERWLEKQRRCEEDLAATGFAIE